MYNVAFVQLLRPANKRLCIFYVTIILQAEEEIIS